MGHSPAGPQWRLVTQTFRTLFQQLHQALSIGSVQQRLATGSTSLLESRLASDFILLPPTARGFISDLQSPTHLAGVERLAEQLDGRQPSLFQCLEVPPNSLWIPHTN